MTIKTSGRAALILATGLWFGCAGTSPEAANAATTLRHGTHHHLKKYAHHKSNDEAEKPAVADKKADDNGDTAQAVSSSDMPASVANANAQWPTTTTTTGNAQAMPGAIANMQAAAGNPAAAPAASVPVVAADQLSDADRALRDTPPAAPPVAVASTDAAPAATASPPAAAESSENSGDNSTWDKTSLIGKIFVGFGALLTMASAARMFMA